MLSSRGRKTSEKCGLYLLMYHFLKLIALLPVILNCSKFQISNGMLVGVGRGAEGLAPLDFLNFSRKGCFRSFEWEKTNFITFDPPRKILGMSPSASPWKNSSETHGHADSVFAHWFSRIWIFPTYVCVVSKVVSLSVSAIIFTLWWMLCRWVQQCRLGFNAVAARV